jgi:hypothetical protein
VAKRSRVLCRFIWTNITRPSTNSAVMRSSSAKADSSALALPDGASLVMHDILPAGASQMVASIPYGVLLCGVRENRFYWPRPRASETTVEDTRAESAANRGSFFNVSDLVSRSSQTIMGDLSA